MRVIVVSLTLLLASLPLAAQPRPRMPHSSSAAQRAQSAEIAVKEAAEELGAAKKSAERDLKIFARLRAADEALADSMQPSTSIEKAHDEVSEAERLVPEFLVEQGVIRIRQDLETARRSPGTADFDRLRSVLRNEAMRPAARVVIQNAMRLQEQTLAWIRVQQLIADHVRELSEITGESLRAVEK